MPAENHHFLVYLMMLNVKFIEHQMEKKTVCDEFIKIWKETAMTHIKILQLAGGKKVKLSKPCKSNNELGSVVPIVGALVIGKRYIR
jgi:hypothetical protein